MSLIVCPASQVRRLVQDHAPQGVVSLISPDAVAPDLGLPGDRHRVLRFHDIAEPRAGLTPPDLAVLEALLAFADTIPGPLLLHCFAGISRSPAAAYILACRRAGPGAEIEIAARLRALSPSATPNPWLVALADERLARRGAMSAAIRALGRGAEAFEGEVFELS